MAGLVPIQVRDAADPRLADYVRLTDASLRKSLEADRGLFVAEGEKVIRRGIEAGYPVRSLLVTEDKLAGMAGLADGCAAPVYVLPAAIARQLTGYQVHRGALVAVLKTGAAYALLDPSWPDRRVTQATARLDSPVLVAEPGTRSTVRLWTVPSGPAAPPRGFRAARVKHTDPCAVFFTSGTTGTPKAVLTTHRATARLFQGNSFASFGPGSAMPLAAPVPWDV